MIKEHTYFNSGKFIGAISDLSKKAGFPVRFPLRPLKGGRNNCIFCIDYQDGRKILLKVYFQHTGDIRDRLKTEYSFLNFAWNNNIRCLPKPISADFQNKLGLYGFIEGRKLARSEIDKEKINQALGFFIELNKHKQLPEAKALPVASEACFSIREHIDCVEGRLEKLKKINDFSKIDHKAVSFIQNELFKEWKKTLEFVNKSVNKYNLRIDDDIPTEDRCLSPSDFGYHNALLKSNRLYFIDFEYAGWDEPAKMVCDFFCQPEVKVPFKYLNSFVRTVGNSVLEPEKFKQRVDALLPIYKIKWCCILLNEFLEVGHERRSFAHGKIDLEKQKIKQLEKAKEYLEYFKFKRQ